MRLIICGSREIGWPSESEARRTHAQIARLAQSLPCGKNPSEVLSGHCAGVDFCGEEWAEARGIPVRRFPADWSQGPKAGPLRNQQMVDEADAVVAIAYPNSRGTKDCVRRAIAKGIPVAMLVLPRRTQ